MINTYRNTHNTSPVPPTKYPTTMSPTKPPILTQKITADFQLSQEAWKQVSSQMNKIVETNKLSKKAVQGTYKMLIYKYQTLEILLNQGKMLQKQWRQ